MIEPAPLPVGPQPRGFAAAIDREKVEQLVNKHLATDCEARVLRPGYVRYKGRDGALIGWWIALSSQPAPTFVTVRVADPGRLAVEAEKMMGPRWPTPPGLQPLALLHERNLLLLSFPLDRSLGRLRRIIKPRFLRALLAERLPGLIDPGWRLKKKSSWILVRYKPERRAVLRWDLVLRREQPASRESRTLFCRLHDEECAAHSQAVLRLVRSAGLRCPEPLGVVDDRLGFEDLLEGIGLSLEDQVAGERLQKVGRMLARLHALDPPPGTPRLSWVRELDRVYQSVSDLGHLNARIAHSAEVVVERLAETIPQQSSAVLLHGDFHSDQILFDDGEPGLVDFDRSVAGSACYDLASFQAHLYAGQCVNAGDLYQRLLHGYRNSCPLPPENERTWAEACLLLRLSLMPFRRLRHDWPEQALRLVDRAATLTEKL